MPVSFFDGALRGTGRGIVLGVRNKPSSEIVYADDDAALAKLAGQFDHVLMTAPIGAIVPSLAYLDFGGVMTYIGIGTGSPLIQFDANNFHFRKLQLRASFASPAMYFPATLRLLKSGVIPGDLLVSHTFTLDRIADAMAAARDDKAAAVKIVVKP